MPKTIFNFNFRMKQLIIHNHIIMKHNLYNNFTSLRAYTLTEMAMVLLIISLISASVMGGFRYIEQARISKTIAELTMYKNAFKGFVDKYKSYPGDMSSATDIFGVGIINGDGNERLDTDQETLIVWQHLAAANFIEKPFATSGDARDVLPVSSINGEKTGFYAIRTNIVDGITKTFLEVGGISNNTRGWANVGIMTPEKALSIDLKIDNGIANSGNLRGITGLEMGTLNPYPANSCSIVPNATNLSGYNTTITDVNVCTIIYLLD